MPTRRSTDRRAFLTGLLGLGAGALAGCASVSRPAAASSPTTHAGAPVAPTATLPAATTPAAATTPEATATPSASSALPASTLWTPGPGEIDPDVKLRAAQLVEALAAWPAGGEGLAAARARVTALGIDPALADEAGPLLAAGPQASVQVVYAQYGGILTSSANVMVILRQWVLGASGAVTAGGTTVQVLLSAAQPRWQVTSVIPGVAGAPASPPPALAAGVLANPRIHLPPAAEADVRSGQISAGTLTALQTLADAHVLDVSVIKTGHPLDVFGTSRLSDHPRGHAADVRAIDGHAVVDPATPQDLIVSFMEAGRAAGAYQVGGPIQLSAPGFDYFTDNTHHDHVHLGFAG